MNIQHDDMINSHELRTIQLEVLDTVHRFCLERGLRYSLGGGTLLGAVRHKGYIPWDDDIDIMMPRPDYERFLLEFPDYHADYWIHSYHNDIECFLGFVHICDRRTIFTEYVDIRGKVREVLQYGAGIEVFAIDGLPSPDKMDIYMEGYDECVGHIWASTRMRYYTTAQLARFYLKQLIYPFVNIQRKYSRKESIRRLEEYLMQYNFDTSCYAGAITGAYGLIEHMPAETFRNYINVPFEGKMYKAIADYDAYLSKHYGDYMTIPPKEKQTTAHNFTARWKK